MKIFPLMEKLIKIKKKDKWSIILQVAKQMKSEDWKYF